MLTRLRRRLRQEESGFTLIELMVAAAVGSVVVLVAFGLLDATVRTFGTSADRTDVAQRGRRAMDTVTQRLRSPVCLPASGNTTAFLNATSTSVRFWSDLSGSDFRASTPQPVVREISLTGGQIVETIRTTPTGAVTQTNVLLEKAAATSDPVFRYYALDAPPAGGTATARPATVPLTAPVSSNSDRSRIARITVAFRADARNNDPKVGGEFVNDVYIRAVDPGDPQGRIRCIGP